MGLVVVVELKVKVWLDWLERVIRMDQTGMGENIVECKPEDRVRWKEHGKAQNEMAGRRRGVIYSRITLEKRRQTATYGEEWASVLNEAMVRIGK
jgi:hypothetical protein